MMSQIFEMQFLKWIYFNKPFYSRNTANKRIENGTTLNMMLLMLYFILFLCYYLNYCISFNFRTSHFVRMSSYFSIHLHLHFCWSFYFRFCLLWNNKIKWWFFFKSEWKCILFKFSTKANRNGAVKHRILIATLYLPFFILYYNILQWRVPLLHFSFYSINNNYGLRTFVASTIDAINILLNDYYPWTWWTVSTGKLFCIQKYSHSKSKKFKDSNEKLLFSQCNLSLQCVCVCLCQRSSFERS